MLFDGASPVILNDIEHIVTRPDLAVFLTLEPIPEERPWPEADGVKGQPVLASWRPARAVLLHRRAHCGTECPFGR